MQGLTPTAITASEKLTLMLDSTLSHDSHSSAKSKSRSLGHNACLKSMSRTITVQGLILTAITAAEKRSLMLESM